MVQFYDAPPLIGGQLGQGIGQGFAETVGEGLRFKINESRLNRAMSKLDADLGEGKDAKGNPLQPEQIIAKMVGALGNLPQGMQLLSQMVPAYLKYAQARRVPAPGGDVSSPADQTTTQTQPGQPQTPTPQQPIQPTPQQAIPSQAVQASVPAQQQPVPAQRQPVTTQTIPSIDQAPNNLSLAQWEQLIGKETSPDYQPRRPGELKQLVPVDPKYISKLRPEDREAGAARLEEYNKNIALYNNEIRQAVEAENKQFDARMGALEARKSQFSSSFSSDKFPAVRDTDFAAYDKLLQNAFFQTNDRSRALGMAYRQFESILHARSILNGIPDKSGISAKIAGNIKNTTPEKLLSAQLTGRAAWENAVALRDEKGNIIRPKDEQGNEIKNQVEIDPELESEAYKAMRGQSYPPALMDSIINFPDDNQRSILRNAPSPIERPPPEKTLGPKIVKGPLGVGVPVMNFGVSGNLMNWLMPETPSNPAEYYKKHEADLENLYNYIYDSLVQTKGNIGPVLMQHALWDNGKGYNWEDINIAFHKAVNNGAPMRGFNRQYLLPQLDGPPSGGAEAIYYGEPSAVPAFFGGAR